jgi:oxygen-independent coproporphyrinogen-3 oxidase
MGYTTRRAPAMLAAGVSGIGDVAGAYAQNTRKLSSYYRALDGGRFPIERGYALTFDDRVRRHVITELMCNFRIERGSTEQLFGVDFDRYFATELEELQSPGGPVDDGLLDISPASLAVSRRGRLFVRNICMVFDAYLNRSAERPAFSRTI